MMKVDGGIVAEMEARGAEENRSDQLPVLDTRDRETCSGSTRCHCYTIRYE